MELLSSYDWPGNVRQVVNAARRLTVTAPGTVITPDDIPADLGGAAESQRATQDWTTGLTAWAQKQLSSGDTPGSGKAAGLGPQYACEEDEVTRARLTRPPLRAC